MINFVILFILGFATFFCGWFLVRSFKVKPEEIYSAAFFQGIALLVCLYLLMLAFKAMQFKIGLILAVLCFIAGYLINTKIFLSQKDTRKIPDITRKEGESKGHTAVVYFTHGEPETFNPIGWINQFREFDEQGIKFIPFFARPVFIYELRKKYLQVGRSNHRQGHYKMLEELRKAFKISGDSTTKFYISFLDDEPRPDAALIQALNEGAEKIIVATVFLTISNHTAEGKKLIEKVDCEKRFKVKLQFTRPLWDSKTLMQAFVDKVYSHSGNTPKEKTAIAFIAHGQPVEWDREFPTMTQQENLFCDQLIETFIEEGFKKENLGKAWMEFKDPKPCGLMQKFVNNKVEKIFYFAASISADAIHSQSDIPALVNQYKFPEDIEVMNLGAWNDHPLVIKAIKERIDEQINITK
ncbi:MAG: ferrochelatase [Bacteroidales bacterium]